LLGDILDTLPLGGRFSRALKVTIIHWAVAVRSGLDSIRACVPHTGKWCSILMVMFII